MVRSPAVLYYRTVENRRSRYARHASVSRGFGIPLARLLMTRPGRLYHPLLTRAGVAALVLLPFYTLARAFVGAGMLEQSLAALALALLVGAVQTLVEPCVAARAGLIVPAEHIVSAGCGTQPSVAEPAGTLLPLPAIHKGFDDMVRRALTHLSDPTKLSLSPLLQLSLVTITLQEQGLEDTRLQRVAVLKALLTDLVHDLRPQQQSDGCAGAAHRFYNCLYYPYVRGITRRTAPTVLRRLRERREREGGPRTEEERVVEWMLQVNEDTYYKWQRRGSDTIALILRERESIVGALMSRDGGHAASA